MSVLVTGAKGMLGFDLCNYLRERGHSVVEWDLPEHDITDVTVTIREITKLRPKTIFHLAAYTNVDACEEHRADAYKVNTMGAWTMAIAARDSGADLVFTSTDYVFDGKGSRPYVETDKTGPASYYGVTKLLGEQAVERDCRQRSICRTSWLFGVHGKNFVDTILRLAQEKPVLQVVNDQRGSPTYTKDLCLALEKFAGAHQYGIFHVSNSGECTWFDFAVEIVRLAGLSARVEPTTSDKYVRPAKRPAYSVLDNSKYRLQFGFTMPAWQEALRGYLRERGMLRND